MMQAYPLTYDALEFKVHSVVGIYEFYDRIACIHCASGIISAEEYTKGHRAPSYILSDIFSADFDTRSQSCLVNHGNGFFTETNAICYWEEERFYLNTRRYQGFVDSIGKIIEIRADGLVEIGVSPLPIKRSYSDSQTYVFGDKSIRMASQFMMECRFCSSGELIWKLKLNAYLYTDIEERSGLLYFGTAGNGGRIYGVSLAAGEVIFSYNTGGTEHFAWHENKLLVADRKGKPTLLNPSDGSELCRIDFGKFRLTMQQLMLIKDNRLYAVATDGKVMHAVCADL